MDAVYAAVRPFCATREWDRYHTPQVLAIGITTEATELLQEFRFLEPDEQVALFDDPDRHEAVEDECADVLFFLLGLADRHDIDLEAALHRKLAVNAECTPRWRIETTARIVYGRSCLLCQKMGDFGGVTWQ
jgi:Phosphoribosyl-ATP pyrophosphohydrolase.